MAIGSNALFIRSLMVSFLLALTNPFAAYANCADALVNSTSNEDFVSYKGQTFQITKLGRKGFEVTPRAIDIPSELWSSPILQSIDHIWNTSEFASARTPLHIGEIENKGEFSKGDVPRVLDMPIKFPGSVSIRVPKELEQFKEVLQKAIDFEFSVNRHFQSAYAYLTVDQKFVPAGQSHRNSGPHVDGLQGRAYPKKLRVDHSYLIADAEPTVFFTNSFDLSAADVNIDNFNAIFQAQVDYSRVIQPKPYELVMMDAFTVHESPTLTEGVHRTLLRLEFSEKVFDRLGNTHNPLFDYSWNMIPKPIPDDLRK